MSKWMGLDEYLAGEETARPRELAYGILREPPAPSFDHQVIVGRVYERLARHVRQRGAGLVVHSPVDVVLDAAQALVVQPDVAFIAAARREICRDRVWGGPDLVVEVLSTATRRHDRTTKLAWYREYGVRECWIVDPISRQIVVVPLTPQADPRTFEEDHVIRSVVLPRLRFRVRTVFELRTTWTS